MRKAVSLFSGAGGLDLGAERAGFEVACAVELNEQACASLRANRALAAMNPQDFDAWFDGVAATQYRRWTPQQIAAERARIRLGCGVSESLQSTAILQGDLRAIPSAQIAQAAGLTEPGALDLVLGGPPCQSFSRAGKMEGVDDARGQLFMEFCRVVHDLRPRWFLFENVKGLAQTKVDVWHHTCGSCGEVEIPPFDTQRTRPEAGARSGACRRCGASTCWEVVRRKPGGSLDLILNEFDRINYQTTAVLLNSVDFGVPQKRERLFVVGTRDGEAFVPPNPSHFAAHSHEHQHEGRPPYVSVWDTLFSSRNPNHPWPLDPEQAVLWVKNVVRPHDEPVTWDLRRPSPTVGAHQGAKMAIAHAGVPEAQLLRQQWHTRGRRQGDTPPVPVEHSYLSDGDLLQLQTFPRSWFLSGTRMQRAVQVGNAVPPRFAQAIVEGILAGAGQAWVQRPTPRGMRLGAAGKATRGLR